MVSREAKHDCQLLEDLLTKATKMFHPHGYMPTMTRYALLGYPYQSFRTRI